MQTTSISNAQRSYMTDPKAFRDRMHQRAAELWNDGYYVMPGYEVGEFFITTPQKEAYTVAPLQEGCTCAYQAKGGIPQVPCKHIAGLECLIGEQIRDYLRMYRQNKCGNQEQAIYWKRQHDALKAAWEETQAQANAVNDAAQIEAEMEDGRNYMANLHAERSLR
jgi:hypothetical protein